MGDLFNGYNQFINWTPIPKGNGKIDKIPIGPDGMNINHLNPANWFSEEQARANGQPIGFVFTEDDPFFFVDIDDAAEGGDWSSLAKLIMSAFPGCYIEVSQSGTGLHIFGVGSYPGHGCTNKAAGLELYTSGRFVALTGTNAVGHTNVDGQLGLNWFVQNYFQPKSTGADADWTTEPCPEWAGPDDDAELIKRAKRAKSAASTFDGKASFGDLYSCNVDKLEECYPTQNSSDPFGYSEAEAALASHLAFFTGKNCERIERIMSGSPLCQRDKWIDREDYRRRTILGAVSICQHVYNRPPGPDPIGEPGQLVEGGGIRAGSQFLDLHGQFEHFKGCCYVVAKHAMFSPQYRLITPNRFNSTYGGYEFAYSFSGKPTTDAFKTFTESQLYTFPKVYGTCFRPEDVPGSIVVEEGVKYVNTYYPIAVDRTPGDPGRFLDLLRRILPDERDRTILLSYMAACVQHVGYKFQWAPLLQGTEGNGKTFLATAVSKAVGERYSHPPNAKELGSGGSKFTGWLNEKLFIYIEDVYTPDGSDLRESLKPLITNRKIEIQHKGADQITGDNRANFMLFSNHKDALAFKKSDRRYCVFFSAQQSVEDILASGMGGSYFPDLYNWARAGGYAIITDYLFSYQIPEEFNPAGACHRAPITTSTRESINLSLGAIEQEILEAVEESRQGFRGGWISSTALDDLLREKRKRLAPNKRKELLEGLGYQVKERMNSPSGVPIDKGKKPILYVTGRGEVSVRLMQIAPGMQTAAAYELAQQLEARVQA